MILGVAKKHWEAILLVTGICVITSLLVMVFLPFEYRASTQLLVIQKQSQSFDAYTAIKSSERVGKNLAQIIFTSTFYDRVVERDPLISSFFPQDDIDRRDEWENAISVNVIPETGIMNIFAYNTDQSKAHLLVSTISDVLVDNAEVYHGNGDVIDVKVVDSALTSKYPVRPNIVLNTLLALFVGVGLGLSLAVIKEARSGTSSIRVSEQEDEDFEDAVSPLDVLVSPVLERVPVSYETGIVSSADGIVTMHDHLNQ